MLQFIFKHVNSTINFNRFQRIFLRGFHLRSPHGLSSQLATNFKVLHFTSNASSGKINDIMYDALKNKDLQETLYLFDLANREGIIPEPKIYAQAIYLLMNNTEYEKVDQLYEEMNKHGIRAGEGVRVTLIRSYVCRKMWSKALNVLDQLEKDNLLRHTRAFNIIIKALLEEGLTYLAFDLFERKLSAFHRISSGSENITRDVRLYAAMIKSCATQDESQKSLKTDLYNYESHTQNSENNDKMFSISTENRNKHSLVYKLFQFFYKTGMKLPPEVLDACKEWSIDDKNHTWSWRFCAINRTGKCNICGTMLHEHVPHNYFKELQEELIKLFSGEDGKLELNQAEIEELGHVRNVCDEKVHFNVIIDAQNLGLEGKRKDSPTPYLNGVYEKRLLEVVKHFSKKNKTIFLPLNVKALNDISGKALYFLRSHCELYIVKTSIDEDLVVLYAAALSGMDGDTCIVTNDNWRDHCAMLSDRNHWKLLKWTRLNHVSFSITKKNRVQLQRNLFDPVIMKISNSWHFPMDNGHWQCAKLK